MDMGTALFALHWEKAILSYVVSTRVQASMVSPSLQTFTNTMLIVHAPFKSAMKS
jgi:hypothetical protein